MGAIGDPTSAPQLPQPFFWSPKPKPNHKHSPLLMAVRSAIGHRPSAIGHRPSAIGHRPSAIGDPTSAPQPPQPFFWSPKPKPNPKHSPLLMAGRSAIGHRPSAIGHRPSAIPRPLL